MRFIFFTDVHLRGTNPVRRIDDFPMSLLDKMEEVYTIASSKKVDFVLFGGDLFDSYHIYSHRVLKRARRIMESSGLKTYGIVGQHDIYGYNKDSLSESTLSFFEDCTESFKLITEPLEFDDCVIYANNVYDRLEDGLSQPVSKKKRSILLAHHLICDKDKIFDVHITKNLKTNFNIVLSGDLHDGFKTHKIGKTIYANPGSLCRIKVSSSKRPIQCLYVDTKILEVETIKLKKYLSPEECFGRSLLDDLETLKEKVDAKGFVDAIESLSEDCEDIYELIGKAGKIKKIKPEIIKYIEGYRDEEK